MEKLMNDNSTGRKQPWTPLLYLSAAGTGASGLIGLESFWIWYVANVFHEISKYPYAYPLAKIAMCLCLILFSAFIILWVISLIRRKQKRFRAVIFSLLFVLTGCGFGYLAITVVTILKDTYLH